MIYSINNASASISASYSEALKGMSSSLARIGSGKRFQTAAEDLGGYLKLHSIQVSRGEMEAAQKSISEAKGFLVIREMASTP